MNPTLSNRILLLLSLVGSGISGFLTYLHVRQLTIPCGKSGGCEAVASHWSAHGFGISFLSSIPTAAFGVMLYAGIIVLCFVRAASTERLQSRAGLVQWFLLLMAFGGSVWLTYMEAFVIHAWCKWCVGNAAVVVVMFIVSSSERFYRRNYTPDPTPIIKQIEELG